jgi:hypothetical protein
MKIRVGVKEIAVPGFISAASEENKKQFHAFLKEVLTAQAEKTRNKIEMEFWKKAKQDEAIAKMMNGDDLTWLDQKFNTFWEGFMEKNHV